jgi:sugar-specific transcriptional regulator TrmB
MDINAHLRSILSFQGLSLEEIDCYLALVKDGQLSALNVSRSSKIPRTSVYRALDSLIRRGLVGQAKRNRRTVYSAEHPRSLLHDIHSRQQALTEAIPLFEELLFKHPAQPATSVYTGRKGFATAFDSFYDHIQRERIKQIYSLSHPDLIKRYPRLFAKSVERREKLKTHIFLMMPDKVPHTRSPLLEGNSLREVRYVPQAFAENTSMLIGGSTVLYISLHDKDSHAILVNSSAISYLLREFFKVVWSRVAQPRNAPEFRTR